MKTVIFLVMLIGFLVILRRWRGDEPGTYDPAMVLLLAYLFFEYARFQSMHPQLEVIPWAKVTMVTLLASLFFRLKSRTTMHSLGRRQNILLLAYVTVAAISIFGGIHAETAIDPFVDLVKMVTFCLVITLTLNTEGRLVAFIWTLLILNLKLAQHHIRGFQREVGHIGLEHAVNRGADTGTGFFQNSGDFGVAMCVVLPMAFFAIWWARHRPLKWLAALMTMTFVLAIYSTGSRGAFLGALAIGAVIWLKMPRKTLALASATAIALVVLYLAPGAYWERMGTIVGSSDAAAGGAEIPDRNVSNRLELWKAGLRMTAEFPFFGVGIGNFRVALKQYLGD